MRMLNVGDVISYRPYGNMMAIADKVTSIEICKPGMKYGREVTSCDLDKHSNVVITVSNNHWCYKDQLIDINQK